MFYVVHLRTKTDLFDLVNVRFGSSSTLNNKNNSTKTNSFRTHRIIELLGAFWLVKNLRFVIPVNSCLYQGYHALYVVCFFKNLSYYFNCFSKASGWWFTSFFSCSSNMPRRFITPVHTENVANCFVHSRVIYFKFVEDFRPLSVLSNYTIHSFVTSAPAWDMDGIWVAFLMNGWTIRFPSFYHLQLN